jgi:hypothetical protein
MYRWIKALIYQIICGSRSEFILCGTLSTTCTTLSFPYIALMFAMDRWMKAHICQIISGFGILFSLVLWKMSANKIFSACFFFCFLFENIKKIVLNFLNFLLMFQNKWNLYFFMNISILSLASNSNVCHIIWIWKNISKVSQKHSSFFKDWRQF